MNKINGSNYYSDTKLFLYSAHDINVAFFLMTLGLYDYSSGMPPYGSYIEVEIHALGEGYGIQVINTIYTNIYGYSVKFLRYCFKIIRNRDLNCLRFLDAPIHAPLMSLSN